MASYRLPSSSTGPGGRDPEGPPHPGRLPGRRLHRRQVARRGVAVLPTLFTLGNLLCGFIAVFLASRDPGSAMPWHWTPITFAAVFVFLGMVFDALDGRIARLTRSTSDLGAQLDSMADMVTFGVAPAFIAVQLVRVQVPFFALDRGDGYFDRVALVVAAMYVACAALRLARFNIEAKSPEATDHMSFKGLPSPGAAGTVASMALLHEHLIATHARGLAESISVPAPLSVRLAAVGMVLVMFLAAFAMVSRLRYVHVVNRYVRGRARFSTVAKAVMVGLVLVIQPQAAIAACFSLYAVSAPAVWLWCKVTGRPTSLAAYPVPPRGHEAPAVEAGSPPAPTLEVPPSPRHREV